MTTRSMLALSTWLLVGGAGGNPSGGSVVAGSAAITQQGKVLTVTSTSAKTAIDWQSFSIAADEITRFVQPSADSSVLNRVLSQQPSVLLGGLESNGRVFLINPAGILVGEGARIDVGAFVASSLHLRLEDFMADRFDFQRTPGAGRVENRGHVRSAAGGSIFLVAPDVQNHGRLESPGGEVILAAGDTVSLLDTATPGVRVELGAAPGQVTNLGQVLVEAGSVGIAGALVRNSGSVSADSVVRQGGRVFLSASDSLRTDEGSVVSADGATRGGEIEISAGSLMSGGTLSADGGEAGGLVRIAADTAVHAGRISATGATGAGGAIDITVADKALHNRHSSLDASGTEGGGIREVAGNGLTGSASYRAVGSQGQGGRVDLSAADVTLLSADVDVRGASGGGQVRIGGELRGGRGLPADELPNAGRLAVSAGTRIQADATVQGSGGSVVLWSDESSLLFPVISARGSGGGEGGFVELSSAEMLRWGGSVDAGPGGQVLLDPRNIVIGGAAGGGYQLALILRSDTVALGDRDRFGSGVALFGDQLAVGAADDDGAADSVSSAGAVYLFTNATTTPSLAGIIGSGYTGPGNFDLGRLDAQDGFGAAVALAGTNLAVGAPGDAGSGNSDNFTGAVYLFNFSNNAFAGPQLVGTLGEGYVGPNDVAVPGLFSSGSFGLSVSLNAAGDRLAVGKSGNESGQGNPVRLFTFNDTAFGGGALALTIDDGFQGLSPLPGAFGSGVALNAAGDRLAVGAQGDRGVSGQNFGAGAVYLIGFSDNDFSNGQLLATLGAGYSGGNNLDLPLDNLDEFGSAVAFDAAGTRLVVGARGDAGLGNTVLYGGGVLVFDFADADFNAGQLVARLGQGYPDSLALALDAFDVFGSDLALDQVTGRLAVGASGDDGTGNSLLDSGAVYLFGLTGGGDPATGQTFAANPGTDVTITPASITAILNAGTALTLQANNDITVDQAVVANNPGGDGGDLTLQAGRSILVNADIRTDSGNLVLVANDANAQLGERGPGGASISVAVGAAIDTGSGTLDMQIGALAGVGTMSNAGTLDIGGGLIQGARFDNAGTVNLNAGTLGITIPLHSSDTGTYNLAAGTQLVLNSGGFRALEAGGVIAGDGQLLLESGQFTLGAGSSYSVATRITGGLFEVNQAGTSIPSLELAGTGLFGGNADVTVGDFSWTGGTPFGATLLTTTGNTVISGSGTRSMQKNWVNNGVISLAGDASLQVTAGRTLTNAVGAVFNLDGTADSAVLGVFDNRGVFNKNSVGVQAFGSSLGSFVNSGTLNVLAGELRVAGSGVDSGTYAIGGGTTLAFTGGTRTLAAGSAIGGDGSLVLSGGSIDLNGDLPIAGTVSLQGAAVDLDTPGTSMNLSAGLALSGGSLVTADDIVAPNLAWTGGTLSGNGSLETTGAGSVIGAAGTRLLQIDWLNSGVASLEDGASLSISGASTLRNTGQFTLAGTGGIITADTGVFLNDGTLTKTSAATQSIALTNFANAGSVEISSGQLNIDADGADTGIYEIADFATLAFVGGDRSINADGVTTFAGTDALRGQGAVRFLGGTLTFAGGGATDSATALDLAVDLGPIVPGSITQPANGNVVDNGNGTFTYTPNGLFAGIDSFSFLVDDGAGNQRVATIDINVNLAAQLATWIGSTGGAWEDPANWQNGVVPGFGFRVEIPDFAGQITVTYGAVSGTTELSSLESYENLRLTGGTLSLGFAAGDASLIGPGASLLIDAGTLSGAGTLSIEGGLQQSGGSQTGPGTTVIEPGATASLGNVNLVRALVNRGVLTLADTTLAATLVNTGQLLVDGNASIAGGLQQTAGTTRIGAGRSLTLGGTGLALAGGLLEGGGVLVGDVDNSGGVIAPGTSPGTLSISGNYVQGPGGTLAMEIGGRLPGVDHDLLNVSGSVVLDGTLSVSLINGFVPAPSDLFTLIQAAGGLTGTFATLSYPFGYQGVAQYAPNAFLLSLVATASPGLTLPPALVGLAWAAGGPYPGVRIVPPQPLLENMQTRGLLNDLASLWIPGDSPFAAGLLAAVDGQSLPGGAGALGGSGGSSSPGAGTGSGGSGAAAGAGFIIEGEEPRRGSELPLRGIVPFPLFYGQAPDDIDEPDIRKTGMMRRPVGFCTVGGA